MSDDYTPTTEDIREELLWHTAAVNEQMAGEAFDRWLAAHDAATRTAALEEAAGIADAIGLKRKSNACLEVVAAIGGM